MNVIFNNNSNKSHINKSQSKEKNKNYIAVFYNLANNQNRYLSENQRNLTKFNSQKKIRKKESKNNNHKENKNNAFLISFNDNNTNNIKLNNYTNLLEKTSKGVKTNKNKSHCLSKPKLEIEINNSNNFTRVTNNKKYKKNISEHDLVNNILNTFTNNNFQKGINIKLNFSSKKKLSHDNNKPRPKTESATDNKKSKQNKSNNNKKNKERAKHSSDTKLLRSSSGYSSINHDLAQTNSFLNNNHSNHLGYIPTCGNNNLEWTNTNLGNIVKLSNQKKSNNSKQKNKANKGPIIGKIIKNYKNNDLKCIFNMNLMQPVTPLNNIQEYFKNLYKLEYNSDNKVKKINKKNKKEKDNNEHKEKQKKNEKEKNKQKDKEKDKEIIRTKNNDVYNESKNTMTKTTDISKIKKEKDSIDNQKYYNDSPEEIHFYFISSIQNGKNMVYNLTKK